MSILDRFQNYADAFELSYEDDDWTRLEAYFTEDAVYLCGPGDAVGRDAVLAKLKGSVGALDRTMDTRKLDFQTPTVEGNTLRVKWTVTYTKTGNPELTLYGTETVVFEGDHIKLLRDDFTPESEKTLVEWITQHGASS